jgi:hypothetical protein
MVVHFSVQSTDDELLSCTEPTPIPRVASMGDTGETAAAAARLRSSRRPSLAPVLPCLRPPSRWQGERGSIF